MRRALPIIIFLLLAAAVHAASYQISATPLNNSIMHGETATFKFTISNFEQNSRRFQFYTLDPNWILKAAPPLATVPGQSLEDVIISLTPKENIGYGSQGVPIQIRDLEEGVVVNRNVVVFVINPDQLPGEYAASVRLETRVPSSVDPRDPVVVEVNLQNRNALDIEELHIAVESPLFLHQTSTPLAPLGEKTERYTFALDPHQGAGEYPMRVALTYRDTMINQFTSVLTIAEIRDISITPVDEESLFRTATTLSIVNKGNVVDTELVTVPTNWFRALFTTAEPRTGTQKIGGQRYFVWDLTIDPRASTELVLVENYRLLVLVILLAILGVVGYFLFRSPLIAVKETIALHEEGEESSKHLKARIFVKNRTGKAIEGVTVLDRVPGIAQYVKKEQLGILLPTKVVKSEKKGTMLKWDVDILEPYEERILSYALTSRLQIVGKVKLPSAKITFTRYNKERVTYTKNVVFEE